MAVAETGEDAVTGVRPGDLVLVAPQRRCDGPADVGPDGYHPEADSYQCLGVVQNKRGALNGGPEHLTPDAFPARVIQNGIFPCHDSSELWITGRDARPDLTSDRRSHLVDEIVLEAAADRRPKPPL